MINTTADLRIRHIAQVDSPQMIWQEYPITDQVADLVKHTRERIHNILNYKDKSLLLVVGPCSIHDPDAALEYALQLRELAQRYQDDLLIIMRVYFEKPRTRIGWKGLINDPDLDGSFQINRGLRIARELLLRINELGVPAGTEFLDIVTGQYYSDLISWGAIGARTTESQVHRELASGLSCPVGFKNGTDGNLEIACDAMIASGEPHQFLSPTHNGQTGIFSTTGNPDTHLILRGGAKPNFYPQDVTQAIALMKHDQLMPRIMIDLSHANCEKQYQRQLDVGECVAEQVEQGNEAIIGVMIESHLLEGRQNIAPTDQLTYGQSITDPCINLSDTEQIIKRLAHASQVRTQNCARLTNP